MHYLFPGILIFLIFGCANKATPSANDAGTVFSLPANQTTPYKQAVITIVSIKESRCPMNARCIRGGEAIADFRISDQKDTAVFSLCTGPDCHLQKTDGTAIVTLDKSQYRFELQDITPNPAKTLQKELKKAVFSVRKIQ